jgi:hypothetical protein
MPKMKLPNGLSVVHIDKSTYVGDDDGLFDAHGGDVAQLLALGATAHTEPDWAEQNGAADLVPAPPEGGVL